MSNDIGEGERIPNIKGFRYRYLVSGNEYESEKIGFGFPREMSGTYGRPNFDAIRVLNEVLVNPPVVTVYYSPGNPQDSVLCTGIRSYHVANIAIFGIGLIVALVVVFQFYWDMGIK